MISRYRIMQGHVLLAGFLLPAALLYFISGALYTLDIKGHIKKQRITLQLQQPFEPNLDRLTQVTAEALRQRQLPLPEGEPVLRKVRGVYELQWEDLAHKVTLQGGRASLQATLTVRERDLLTQLMRIHRAEAGTAFMVLALMLAAGLIVILASGIYMAQSVPRLRRTFIVAVSSGTALFLALMLI